MQHTLPMARLGRPISDLCRAYRLCAFVSRMTQGANLDYLRMYDCYAMDGPPLSVLRALIASKRLVRLSRHLAMGL